jgi:hypothetical protein
MSVRPQMNDIYWNVMPHPEGDILHSHRRENLKSYNLSLSFTLTAQLNFSFCNRHQAVA